MGLINHKEKIIIIFEDKPENYKRLKYHMETYLSPEKISIIDFQELYQNSISDKKNMKNVLDYIFGDLKQSTSIEMVIVDLDLSEYGEGIEIYEPVITDYCNKYNKPVCIFSRYLEDDIIRLQNWADRKIVLDRNQGLELVARQCSVIYKGFQELFTSFSQTSRKKSHGIIELLGGIMGAPEAAQSQLLLYTTGYFRGLAVNPKDEMYSNIFSTLYGYWIYNSLFKFPGVLLNEVATASYLNINVDDFKNNVGEIQEAFKNAEYRGPFSEIAPYWWKDGLDELFVEMQEEINVRELFNKLGIEYDYKPVRCVEGNHDNAGHYCVITKQPVCVKHSIGDAGWFPPGAMLSRISNTLWEELAPWYGF